MQLVIGTKKWSSWSLRPWLVLKRLGEPFTETVIALREHDTTEAAIRAAGSPNGLVPVLKDEEAVIWDSLAICEYLADKFPKANLWPADVTSRALARAAAAEMHAGFHSLRGECSMDLSAEPRVVTLSEATHKDIRRIVELWNGLRARFAGAARSFWVNGPSPTPSIRLSPRGSEPMGFSFPTSAIGEAGRYAETLLETAEFKAWEAGI